MKLVSNKGLVLGLSIFVIFCSHSCPGFEYEWANKVDVIALPKINFLPASGSFIYGYTVYSSKKSVQNVETFEIVVNDEPFVNVRTPYGWLFEWTSSGWGFVAKRGRVVRSRKPYKVRWLSSWAPDDPAGDVVPDHGNVEPSPNDIRPGKSLSGFSFESPSLPGITQFWSRGFVKLYNLSEIPDGVRCPSAREQTFKRATIGPVFVVDKTPLRLIDRLVSLNDEASKCEWMKDPKVTATLKILFEATKESITKTDAKTAKTRLTEIIAILDERKGKEIQENA
jgi:hypothetical protein